MFNKVLTYLLYLGGCAVIQRQSG